MADSSHAGRASSWLAVAVMVAGFVIGGLGLVAGPTWLLFWGGVAVVAVGGVLALALGILSDVVMDEPRDISHNPAAEIVESMETSALGHEHEDVPVRSDAENLPHG